MLEQAAAKLWGVDPSECKAYNHRVVHAPSGKSLDYGELVETAAALPVPSRDQLKLKDPKDFRYIGKDIPIVDLKDIVRGNAVYGIDVRVPGMKYASVEHCPVILGKVKSYDATEALKVPGVEQVVEIPAVTKPILYKALGGVAVVASNTWAALEGRKKLKIEWDYGENAGYDSAAYRKELEEAARKLGAPLEKRGEGQADKAGFIARMEGDLKKAFAEAAKVVEAAYYVPHFVHAQMEPPAAVARVENGICQGFLIKIF
jgi:isoquinoline 1-oxidoreductase beta subunit